MQLKKNVWTLSPKFKPFGVVEPVEEGVVEVADVDAPVVVLKQPLTLKAGDIGLSRLIFKKMQIIYCQK